MPRHIVQIEQGVKGERQLRRRARKEQKRLDLETLEAERRAQIERARGIAHGWMIGYEIVPKPIAHVQTVEEALAAAFTAAWDAPGEAEQVTILVFPAMVGKPRRWATMRGRSALLVIDFDTDTFTVRAGKQSVVKQVNAVLGDSFLSAEQETGDIVTWRRATA